MTKKKSGGANALQGNTSPTSTRLVYSTEHGKICPDCRQATAQCLCNQKAAAPIGDGNVRVSRETKGRNGKSVTVVKGVPLDAVALSDLGKRLRTACGAGGTVKDGVIEIQGDHSELVIEKLKQQGWLVKRAGG